MLCGTQGLVPHARFSQCVAFVCADSARRARMRRRHNHGSARPQRTMPNARLATARVCTVPVRAERLRKVSGVHRVRSACTHRAECCNTIAPRRANPRKQLRIAEYTEKQAEHAQDEPDRATCGCTMCAPLVRNAVLHSSHLRIRYESANSDVSSSISVELSVY